MQNRHKGVKHLRGDISIDRVILLEIHLLVADALLFKNVLDKLSDFFLIIYSICIFDIFALIVFI